MSIQDIFYRRNLPHYHLDGYPLFVTFRLAGTIPLSVLTSLKRQREIELKALKKHDPFEMDRIEQNRFRLYDEWLDRCETGPQWLHEDRIAQIVAKEIHNLSGDRFKLLVYSIMPNHVHLLIASFLGKHNDHLGNSPKYPVADTLRLLKGRTARFCNLELKRSGSFWQHESYDHVVRSNEELSRTILYILNNPVQSGLVKVWKDWKYTYINPDLGKW